MAHDAYSALRSRDYRLLLAGGVLSSIGQGMTFVAVGYDVNRRAETLEQASLLLGLTGLAMFLPILLLALPAGQMADRHDRKRVFQAAQLLIAASYVGLAWVKFADAPVGWVYVCLVLSGVGRAFTTPARMALLPQVVPLEALTNAVSWNSTGWQVANVTGPALGGLVLWQGWIGGAYLLAAGLSLACVVLLQPIRAGATVRRATGRDLNALLAGVRFVWDTRLMLAAITLDLFAVLLAGVTALVPIFVEHVLTVPEGDRGLWNGLLRAAPAFGAVFMAVWLAHRRPLQRPGRALLLAVAGFGVGIVWFGLSRSAVLSFVLLAVTGALDNVSVVVRGTLMQVLTPDEMRGRVAAVNAMFISTSNELGEFRAGVTAAWLGPVWSVVGGGIGTVLVVLLTAWAAPALWRLGPLHELRPASTSPAD